MPDSRAPLSGTGASGCRFTPIFVCQESIRKYRFFPLGMSSPHHSIFRFRAGEGGIRGLLRAMILALLLPAVCPAGTAAGASSHGLRVLLREEAAIGLPGVFVRDVAILEGPDARQLDALGGIRLADTPAYGETLLLTRHQVGETIRAAAGVLPHGSLAGAPAVRVRVRGTRVTVADIEPLLESCLSEKAPWKGAEVSLLDVNNIQGMELPPEGTLRLGAGDAVLGKESILASLEMLQAGRSVQKVWITAYIGVRARVLTPVRKIRRGATVAPEDVETRVLKIPDLRAAYARLVEDAVGKVSRRTLLPGDPLPCEALEEPLLVRNGETVRLRLERGGIALTTLARAEQDGRLGDSIRVRNIDFSAVIRARVSGRAEVRVQ